MKPKVLIVYASMTGNTEGIAEELFEIFKEKNCEVVLFECTQTDARAFLDCDICLIGTYTWGRDGELPDEIVDLYEDMSELDLSGKVYGVFGSGEEFYGNFCKSVDDFDLKFKSVHAVKGAESLKIELEITDSDKQKVSDFADDLIQTFHSLNDKSNVS